MEVINTHKTKAILKKRSVYVSLAVAFIVMMLFFPNEGKFKYEYHKGRPWIYETLVAPMDFPILKTEAELFAEKDAAAAKVIPYYIYDPAVGQAGIAALARLQHLVCAIVVAYATANAFQNIAIAVCVFE